MHQRTEIAMESAARAEGTLPMGALPGLDPGRPVEGGQLVRWMVEEVSWDDGDWRVV